MPKIKKFVFHRMTFLRAGNAVTDWVLALGKWVLTFIKKCEALKPSYSLKVAFKNCIKKCKFT